MDHIIYDGSQQFWISQAVLIFTGFPIFRKYHSQKVFKVTIVLVKFKSTVTLKSLLLNKYVKSVTKKVGMTKMELNPNFCWVNYRHHSHDINHKNYQPILFTHPPTVLGEFSIIQPTMRFNPSPNSQNLGHYGSTRYRKPTLSDA